ncbi:lipoate--protein ligase [Vibrio parahaemolyticus]|uniref:lipoate--protein ligase family protein n=1 Tax=Vibrio parahaemolyticus TaxID=670 RepID=UPI0011203F82|nr:lipoate--protein ligase [Vibrio parahaemolyticus]EGQ7866489.1 lipoate--protein ligase [Vibrio parahaemolyticus]EGQ7884176.1 lipoate--protein ligase [Vibrio parahaemolyticus]EGQ7886524.1 lipoate--protein ligase [Vibrio parahaemolyticus]EGQ9369086.1 lipoate--protein ligase [Vibrio parahaemolyticus]EGQ9373690.1 lipoate--protein ligase [Vibrio parahaemolyticus]
MVAKNKLIRFTATEVADAFEKEDELIKQVQSNQLSQVLLLWQVKSPTLVLPAGKKWPVSNELEHALNTSGWKLFSRKTGGAPVPQVPGIINLSHIYHWPEGEPYNIKKAYLDLCAILTVFFEQLGVKVDVHATPYSYCDGEYNLNIGRQKVVGTAQRVLLKKGGGQVVLSQACILIDANVEKIVEPVRMCNQLCGHDDDILGNAHTPLFHHISDRPSVDSLFQQLTSAFLTHAKTE